MVVSKVKKITMIIILLVLPVVLTLFITLASFTAPEVEYETVNAYSGYHSILKLKKDRSYSLLITSHRGSQTVEIKDKISNKQMNDIRKTLLANQFTTLGRDLSDYFMEDNSTEKLNVKLGFMRLETEGYGITNKRFRDIVKELEGIITGSEIILERE